MRNIFYSILSLIVFYSCDLIPALKKDDNNSLARVYDTKLHLSELEPFMPKGLSSSDSVLFIQGFIDTWAKKELFLHQAELNLSEEIISFEKLVQEYRSTLYINSYKEALISDKLDTLISEEEIDIFYNENKENFKLNEELIQFRYLSTEANRSDIKELVKLFKSNNQKNIDSLNVRGLEFKRYNFNDSVWVKLIDLKVSIDYFKNNSKKQIFKKKFIQEVDTIGGIHLIYIKDYLSRNSVAPKSYIEPTIRQILLQKRKLELLRNLEVDLLENAVKNKNFEKY